MATVPTTATFEPLYEAFDVPMLPNNIPGSPWSPIGRLIWNNSVVVPALTSGDVSEVTVTCNVLPNYALRFLNVSWSMMITGATPASHLNKWSDLANLTFPSVNTDGVNFQFGLQKEASAGDFNITNPFAALNLIPWSGSNYTRVFPKGLSSPIVFRTVNVAGTNTDATVIASQMEALVYTIEQARAAHIYSALAVSTPVGTGTQ